MTFVCKSCDAVHEENFCNYCNNCKPIVFECCNCKVETKREFKDVCNVCYQSETLMCIDCLQNDLKIFYCDGCEYPICERHTERVEILRAIDENTFRKEFLHLCQGFDDRNLCWNGFKRLNLCTEKFQNVYFNRDTVRRELPELNVTRKWADRQRKKITSEKNY